MDCLVELRNEASARLQFVRIGWTFSVKVIGNSTEWIALTITIAASRPTVSKDGITRGLLGRYDGNPDNDLTTANETILSPSASVICL